MTEQSIGKLFMAGVFPGLTQACLFMIAIYIVCRINPQLGPRCPDFTWRQKLAPILKCGEIFLLIFLVLGGLFIGWFTPTEAGAVGAFGAIAISLVRRRLSWQHFKEGCFETARTTGMIYFLVIGAFLMNFFLASTTLPMLLAETVGALPVSPIVIILIIIGVYIVLGMFIDALAMILLTIPIFYPLVLAMNFDPIWFGVILVLMGEIAVITPPVGMNVYAISGIVDVPMQTIFKGVFPFFYADCILIVLLVAFPKLALFLPSIMK
jgi:tripartite ATP-independent transporter DctM subunit